MVGSFKAVLRLTGRTPDPENHSPDLVRISCCLRHRLHTHITWRGWKYKSVEQDWVEEHFKENTNYADMVIK